MAGRRARRAVQVEAAARYVSKQIVRRSAVIIALPSWPVVLSSVISVGGSHVVAGLARSLTKMSGEPLTRCEVKTIARRSGVITGPASPVAGPSRCEVDASGDTLAAGAWFEDSGSTGIGGNQADDSAADRGAVYLFERSGSKRSEAHPPAASFV
jgi:hypothetical protein